MDLARSQARGRVEALPDAGRTSVGTRSRRAPARAAAGGYDVVVAGGGVGGLALATRLARQGRRVAVVERTEFGTFRVGESLDWEAPVFLERLGFDIERWVAEGKATWKGGAVVSNVAQPNVKAEIGFSLLFRDADALVGRARRRSTRTAR